MPEPAGVIDYQKMKRIPVDPRVIDRIQRSARMSYEQGSGFMKSWGGPTRYKTLTKMPQHPRLAYAAILEGHTTDNAIKMVTGLSQAQLTRALTHLRNKGLIKIEQVSA